MDSEEMEAKVARKAEVSPELVADVLRRQHRNIFLEL